MLHDCIDLKSISSDFVCKKGILPTKKKSSAIFTFWWCLEMGGGEGILVIVFWFYALLLISLPLIMSICGPYMDYSWLIFYMEIGKFLIRFFPTDFFSACIYDYPKSCWIILAYSDTLIPYMWKYDLLFSIVFRIV